MVIDDGKRYQEVELSVTPDGRSIIDVRVETQLRSYPLMPKRKLQL